MMIISAITETNIVPSVRAITVVDNRGMEDPGNGPVDKETVREEINHGETRGMDVNRATATAVNGEEARNTAANKDTETAGDSLNPGEVLVTMGDRKDRVADVMMNGAARAMVTLAAGDKVIVNKEAEIQEIGAASLLKTKPGVSQRATAENLLLLTKKARPPVVTKKRVPLKVLPGKP